MSEETVTLIIDGELVEAKEGQTILQAAEAAGIYIPRLCYHPDLPPAGHCRVCTVKVNGRATSSCLCPVSEGIVIETDTDELNELRRSIIEMLFVEGNHYCPSCEASGRCELQALGYRFGMLAPTMPYQYPKRELDATHPDVFVDRDRCILCGRCVRASKILDKKNVFGFQGRGPWKRVAVNGERGLGETDMEATDAAARICPTGSLVVKRKGYDVPVGRRRYDQLPIGAEIEQKKEAGE